MQFKAILTVSLLSAAQVAYAAPPPCLMAAVKYEHTLPLELSESDRK